MSIHPQHCTKVYEILLIILVEFFQYLWVYLFCFRCFKFHFLNKIYFWMNSFTWETTNCFLSMETFSVCESCGCFFWGWVGRMSLGRLTFGRLWRRLINFFCKIFLNSWLMGLLEWAQLFLSFKSFNCFHCNRKKTGQKEERMIWLLSDFLERVGCLHSILVSSYIYSSAFSYKLKLQNDENLFGWKHRFKFERKVPICSPMLKFEQYLQ